MGPPTFDAQCRSSAYKPVDQTTLNQMTLGSRVKVFDHPSIARIQGKGALYFAGASVQKRYDTGVELPFRQDSNFM